MARAVGNNPMGFGALRSRWTGLYFSNGTKLATKSMVYCVHGGTMRLSVAVLVVLSGAALATAQKKDPILVGHSSKPAATSKSVSAGAVAAALNRKSATAGDLAKIERGSAQANASKRASHPPASKNFGAGQDNKENRNKPVNASRPSGLGHRSLHPNPNAS